MIKGAFRVLVVSALGSWIFVSVMEWRTLNDSQHYFVDDKIEIFSIDSGGNRLVNSSSWPVYAATADFIQASEGQRLELAQNFYEQRIQPVEEFYFLGHDGNNVKTWMLRTSALDLNAAPIEFLDGDDDRNVQFRRFEQPFFHIGPRITYVLFNGHVLTTTAFLAVVVTIFGMVLIFAANWIYRGFKRSELH